MAVKTKIQILQRFNNSILTGPRIENEKSVGVICFRSFASVFSCEHTVLAAKSVTVQFTITPSNSRSFTFAVRKTDVGFLKITLMALATMGSKGALSLATVFSIP